MGLLNTLRNISPSLYRLRILAVIVAVLVLPFTLYYLLVVRSQTAYFTERSFRKLSLISGQITSKVESVSEVLKNNTERFITVPYERNHNKTNLDSLKEFFNALNDDTPKIIPISIDPASGDELKLAGTVTLNSVRQDGDAATLYFTYITEGLRNHAHLKIRAKADLQNLLQPLLNTRSLMGNAERDQFQNIFISDLVTGKVIFEHDTTQVRLALLDKLTTADEAAKKLEGKDISSGSNVIDVKLAGTNYKLFSHPVEVPLFSSNGTGTNPSWIVSGLIQSDYFRNQAWSVSYTVLIFCGFITVLLTLSWPFLKLILIGPKDRLGTADIYFLTFSIVIAVGVFTSFGLYIATYHKLEEGIDSNLEKLAGRVKKNFTAELTAALKQLDTFSKNCDLLTTTLKSTAPCQDDSSLKGTIYQEKDKEKKNILPKLNEEKNVCFTAYPYFDTAVWIDKNGDQKAKWTIENEATQYINVSRRAYFSNLHRGSFYKFANAGLGAQEFWLEPIISRTTGRNEVEISKLTNDRNWIAAFDTRLISLMQPVLPAGFGFVVVANDGKVLFHSDEAHHLGENFFQECDDNARLRSAVVGRGDGTTDWKYVDPRFVDVKYVGEGHRVFVTSFDDNFPQWSLIVFQNKQPLRSAFLELLTLVSLLFLLYTIIALVCFSCFYLLNVKNERRAWLWPRRDKRETYYLLFLLMFVVAIVSGYFTYRLHGQSLPFVIALIGLLSILAFFLILRLARPTNAAAIRRSRPPWLGRYDVVYSLNLTLLLLLIAILPAAAFFKYAYESEMRAFIKHGQFTFAAELAKRDQAIRSQYANIDPAEKQSNSVATSFIKTRAGRDWDIYDGFFFDTKHELAGGGDKCHPEPTVDWLSGLYKFVPLFNQVSTERLGVLFTNVSHGCCEWEPAGSDDNVVLHLDKNTDNGTEWPWRHVNTLVPHFEVPGPGWMALFIAAFFPFFLFVRFIVRKVFLLDVYKPSSRPLQAFLNEPIEQNLFIVVDAPFAEKRPLGHSNVYLNDIRQLVNSPGWKHNAAKLASDHAAVLALDNFGYRLDDPELNEQKLSLLEKLLEKNKTLMIFSEAEPSKYSFKNGGNGNGDLDDTGRWARVMSRFFTQYAEDTGDSQAFADRIEEERERILKTDLKGRSENEINELIDTLAAECKPKGPLQQIGLQILTQKSFVTLSREHLLHRILNQAQPYYNHLWNSCSTAEKLTLFHLGKDRLLSHRDPDLERLLRTELIVRDGDVHLLNDSFRQFVTSPEKMQFVAELEETTKRISPWHTLKIPILVVLVAITVFLFVTQRELYASSLAIVTAITTIIPAFFKVLTIFHSDPLASPPSKS